MTARRLLVTVSGGLLALMLGAAVLVAWLYHAPGPLHTDRQIVFARGSGTRAIAERLAQERAVISGHLFYAYAAFGYLQGHRFKAGEYRIPARASAADICALLWSGETVVRQVTIPEGLTVFEIRRRLDDAEGLQGDFPKNIVEGELLPETYRYSWGDTRETVVDRMQGAQQALFDKLWDARNPSLPFSTRKEALTLASIVEKETGVGDERSRVAAVYVNRLRQGMKLQADPTVIYGITGGNALLDRPLTFADLREPTAYNTYVIDGLPPGPIANPGKASIEATLHPADTNDLYFVADGKGGHRFAATLDEHNRNVALYRKAQAAAKLSE